MYYPYLRGKQFELKALREFAAENPDAGGIIPIIEPVNASMNAMNVAVDELIHYNMKFALIMNPSDGDFKYPSCKFDFPVKDFPLTDAGHQLWIPAYNFYGNPEELNAVINGSGWSNAMLVFRTCAEIDNRAVMELINNPKISIVVNDFGNSISRRIRKVLIDSGKSIVCMQDNFITRKRNADYSSVLDEPFTELPYYYKEEGFAGFADYTTLPSEFIEGGMLPYALVIHLTYEKTVDQVYIHHFVSDNNYNQSNVSGKFVEAARKIEPFYIEHDLQMTSSVEEFIRRANASDGYPGLGYIKKLSLKNHLELIKRIIG